MSSALSFTVDANVFFKHPIKSWVVGRITEANSVTKRYTAVDENGEEVKKLSEQDVTLCRADLLNEGIDPKIDDLLFLTVLHEATLLRCLYVRYMSNIVYTNIGAIVVAMNPFNYNIPWYKDDMMEKYLEEDYVIRRNLPHSWAVAHNTYYEMRMENLPHTVLVSGESGAGKTESCKLVLNYLGQVSRRNASQEQMAMAEDIRIKVLQSSLILEGFGNAKTVRNNNSSRFGKFIKVTFHQLGYLVGAFITSYLLEKSRVITAAHNERIYHSFYYLTKGPGALVLDLKGPEAYRSTSSGNCFHVDDINDEKEFNEMSKAFSIFGMSDAEQLDLWKTVAGCMIAQNIEMQAIDKDTTAIAAGSEWAVDQTCNLWGIDKVGLQRELITTTGSVREETFVMNLKLTQSIDARDSLCKHTYEKVFLHIIALINASTAPAFDFNTWIGVLDIFGFEDFETNSFEQLCINLTNETLQYHYNDFIFKMDMDECRAEGIRVDDIKFPDNTECLNLIANNKGIMGYLDEECRLGTGTDESFLAKIIQNCSNNPFFYSNPLSRNTFMVRHYAGNVTYKVSSFLNKNRDTLKDDLKLLMHKSNNKFIADLLSEQLDSKGKMTTIGGFFRVQINDLMTLIRSTKPHWIRCIKPHAAKKPLMFDGMLVSSQLLSSGVLGTVKIRKAGYPVRMTFPIFLMRYKVLFGCCQSYASPSVQQNAIRKAVTASKAVPHEVQLGKTRVFMKSEAYLMLEKARDEACLRNRLLLQAAARCSVSQLVRRKKLWVESAIIIQEEFRAYLLRSNEERMARRLARECMLSEHVNERARLLAYATSILKEMADDESAEYEDILRLKQSHVKWIVEAQQRRIDERAQICRDEDRARKVVRKQATDFFLFQTGIFSSLYLRCINALEDQPRRNIEQQEHREFMILCDFFDTISKAMFCLDIEKIERKYRRMIMRLEDIQANEISERVKFFPRYLETIIRAAYPFMHEFQYIKEHATRERHRINSREKHREQVRETKLFSSRYADEDKLPAMMIQQQLSLYPLYRKDSSYRRVGEKVEPIHEFVSKEPWVGAIGVPDLDQLIEGMKPTPEKRMRGKSATLGHRACSSSPSPAVSIKMRITDDDKIVDMSYIKRGNVFDTFRDHVDENNFLRQRYIVTHQFYTLSQHQGYEGRYVDEMSITDRKTLHIATELLKRISIEFAEELVDVIRLLNTYCISHEVLEQHYVTGHWYPYTPVSKEILQEYPPFTNWKDLLQEEKRLEYIIENFKSEMFKILQQCVARGAKLPEKLNNDSSIDVVLSCYAKLKGKFERCSRCLFPMATKDLLIHMRLLWPHVTDLNFPDRCCDCMVGVTISVTSLPSSNVKTSTSPIGRSYVNTSASPISRSYVNTSASPIGRSYVNTSASPISRSYVNTSKKL